MQNYMYACLLLLFGLSTAFAQINRPRPVPASGAPKSSAPAQNRSAEPTLKSDADEAVATASSADVEIKLMQVEGNTTTQQVTFSLLFVNPKANAQVQLRKAYAVDPAGDAYTDANVYPQRVMLYTDVPKRETRMLKGVPAKVKTLQFAKFDFYHPETRKWEEVEFRNLTINWK